MIKTVLVPLDRSEVSERALPFAQMIARQMRASLRLATVLEVPADYARWIDMHAADEPWLSEIEKIERYLERIASSLDPQPVATNVLMGLDPAMQIDAAMTKLDEALLVMSSHGRSGFKRLVLGSKAARLVQIASYPIVIVPTEMDAPPSSISRILFPLDGSIFAENALEVTLRSIETPNLSLFLFKVIDAILGDSKIDENIRTELHGAANTYLSSVGEDLISKGYSVTWEVDEATDIANRIAAKAHNENVDLIALASHGRSGFSRWFIGSVADALLRSATKPILIVRPSDEVIASVPDSRSWSR